MPSKQAIGAPGFSGLDDAMLLEHVEAVMARLAATALGGAVDDDALRERVRRLARVESAVHAEKLRSIAAVDERKAFLADAERSTADWVAAATGVSQREARQQTHTAAAMQRMPATAAKLADGQITPGHAAAAARGLSTLDEQIQAHEQAAGLDMAAWEAAVEQGAQVTTALDEHVAAQAPGTDPRGLSHAVDAWVGAHAPDAVAQRARRAAARRGHWWAEQRDDDGLWAYWGRATDADRAQMTAAVGPLARKTTAQDARSRPQRDLDAMVELCRRGCDSGALPTVAAQRPHVIQVLHTNVHGDDIAAPWVDGVGPVSTDTAEQIQCDADTTVFTVDSDGTWNLGRADGDPTRAQRRAVIGRDRACVGCDAPAGRCQLHHIVFRSHGGRTTIDNLVLVCWSCHHGLHHLGWTITTEHGRYRIRRRRPD